MSTLQRLVRQRLRRMDAPRVLTGQSIAALAEAEHPGASRSAVFGMVNALEADGDLRKVSRGIYLNRRLAEPAPVAEAAAHIRRGAIVSLHTVLGDAGILNNYTHDVWCVIPQSRNTATSLQTAKMDDGTHFVFRGIPEHRLMAADPADLFAPTSYQRASSEAALCHWIYLWNSPRSELGKLPGDLDLDGVDMDRAARIAEAMGISEPFQAWSATVKLDDEQDVAHGLGF